MGVTYIDIEDQDVGQRADNFLMRELKGVPRQHVYKILRSGEVRVNGSRVKASYRLQPHDRVRIPPVRTREQMPVRFAQQTALDLRAAILFEDDDYILLNKPAGVAVHGGSTISAGVVEILREALGKPRLELVHRLDRDTSGCLALAKNRPALKLAQDQFRRRTVKKIYELFVHGSWPASLSVVQLKLQRFETAWGERRVKVSSQGQSARTDFKVLERAGRRATRLQASLHTGRTHQIRVHTSASGHAIVGDDKYASRSGEGGAPDSARLCLHARKLVIPIAGRELKVEAPLDEEMTQIWAQLKHDAS